MYHGIFPIFLRGRIPLSRVFIFFISLRPSYQSALKSTQMLFVFDQTSLPKSRVQLRDLAHLFLWLLVHERHIVSRSRWVGQQCCQNHNANKPFFWQDLSLLSIWCWSQAPANGKIFQKKIFFCVLKFETAHQNINWTRGYILALLVPVLGKS